MTRLVTCAGLVCLALGCKAGRGGDPDADADAVDEADALDADMEDQPGDADIQQEEPPLVVRRALLVDMDLLHPSAWLGLHEAAVDAGLDLAYRRHFPHVVADDVQGDGSYDMILVAGGGAPGMAAARLSFDEIDEMASFVEGGGILVLMPQPTRLDASYGENDWFIMNRLLERIDSSMRIEKGSLIGPLFLGDPEPAHLDTSYGYSTLLEFDMGYAFVFPTGPLAGAVDGPVPAGRATVLRTLDTDVEVLLAATPGARLWIRTYGSTVGDQIRSITDERPVAAVERVKEGFVAVIPRYLVTLAGAGGQISEHPALSTATMSRNADVVGFIVAHLKDLAEGAVDLVPGDPSGGDDREFWVEAPGIPPAGTGDVIGILQAPNRRTVPPDLPAGDLDASFEASDPGDAAPAVPLFGGGQGRIGYGGISWDPAQAAVSFSEASEMGLHALIGTFVPERLVTGELTEEQAGDMRAKMAQLGDVAQAQGARWLVGGYYTGHVYNRDPSAFPSSVGAQGQTYSTPLLHAALWDDLLIPAAEEVAVQSAAHEGIAGILLDMEMYGSVLTYTDAQAFDDTTWTVYVETVDDGDLHDMLAAQPVLTRLDTLIENGLLGDYMRTLEQAAERIGARYRDAVRAISPGFVIALYLPGYPTAWQYRGLIRGLASPDNPVIVLTYDPWSHPARAHDVACGQGMVHLGGPILSHFPPEALGDVLASCDDHTDGFWYFSHDEISANATGDLAFGTREQYRTAIATASSD